MHFLARCALLGVVLTSHGCSAPCDLSARASVSLTIVDAETGEATVIQPVVTYRLDGGEEEEAEALGQGYFVLAYETSGHFEVTVAAEGYETVMAEYDVPDTDECHVDGVSDTIELTPVPGMG